MVLKKTSFQDGKCVQFMSTSNTCSNISMSGYVHDDSTPKLHFTLLNFTSLCFTSQPLQGRPVNQWPAHHKGCTAFAESSGNTCTVHSIYGQCKHFPEASQFGLWIWRKLRMQSLAHRVSSTNIFHIDFCMVIMVHCAVCALWLSGLKLHSDLPQCHIVLDL